ncbi:MAG: hypothetical protein AAF221_05045 [Pseudomonadota bacterium]
MTVLVGSIAVPAGSSSLNGAVQQSSVGAPSSASAAYLLEIANTLSGE